MDKDSISKIIQPNFLAISLGFILILPVSIFFDLSAGLVIGILLSIILMFVFHFFPLLYSVDLSFSQVLTLGLYASCLLYTSPSPRDQRGSRMPSSA